MKKDQEKRRISIIGLGLIGGSIGLAFKAAKIEGLEIVGSDREHGAESRAQKMGAIDKAEHNLRRAVEMAGLVIIATPVLAVREVMEEIAGALPEGAIVTDTASTKAEIMKWGDRLLPHRVSFVGGHPMAGKETSGVENAEAGLFKGRAWAICPSLGARDQAVQAIVGLAQMTGAEALFMDAEEHDTYAAAVSHLPLLVSTALFTLLRSSPSWNDLAPMASSGFRDMTRLASGDPRMSHDIMVTNREAAIHWLERMAQEMYRYRDLLQDAQDEELMKTFTRAQLDRDTFLRQPPVRQAVGAPKIDVREGIVDSLVGGWAADKMRKIEKLPELLQAEEAEEPKPGEEGKAKRRRPSLAEKIAEGVRRDLEKGQDEQQKK